MRVPVRVAHLPQVGDVHVPVLDEQRIRLVEEHLRTGDHDAISAHEGRMRDEISRKKWRELRRGCSQK
eukprot:1830286-Pleurochrysis_carterae.AAC.1